MQVARASSCPVHQLLAARETPFQFERDGVAVNTPVNKTITTRVASNKQNNGKTVLVYGSEGDLGGICVEEQPKDTIKL